MKGLFQFLLLIVEVIVDVKVVVDVVTVVVGSVVLVVGVVLVVSVVLVVDVGITVDVEIGIETFVTSLLVFVRIIVVVLLSFMGVSNLVVLAIALIGVNNGDVVTKSFMRKFLAKNRRKSANRIRCYDVLYRWWYSVLFDKQQLKIC